MAASAEHKSQFILLFAEIEGHYPTLQKANLSKEFESTQHLWRFETKGIWIQHSKVFTVNLKPL